MKKAVPKDVPDRKRARMLREFKAKYDALEEQFRDKAAAALLVLNHAGYTHEFLAVRDNLQRARKACEVLMAHAKAEKWSKRKFEFASAIVEEKFSADGPSTKSRSEIKRASSETPSLRFRHSSSYCCFIFQHELEKLEVKSEAMTLESFEAAWKKLKE